MEKNCIVRSRCAPRIFAGGDGGKPDPEAVYNLFDFKNFYKNHVSTT
jgi:hypothetical protein